MEENIYGGVSAALEFIDVNKSIITIIASGCLAGLFYFGIHPLNVKEDATTKEWLATVVRRLIVAVLLVGIPVLFLFVYIASKHLTGSSDYFAFFFKETIYGFKGSWALYVAIILGTLTFKFTNQRIIEPYISNLIRKFRVRQSSEKMSDIRAEIAKTKTKDFEPKEYFKEGFMFLGFDEKGEPIYETDEDFQKRHMKILGPSQTGKGVLQGVLIYQAILKGWCVGFGDIKPDDFIYSIMVKACKDAGRPPPIVLDLNGIGPGTYNMFSGGTKREIISRIQKAFNINETGTNADYYNVKERSLILDIEKYFDGSLSTLDSLLHGKMPDGTTKPEYFEITEKSRAYVKEMKMHKPLNPKKGRGFNIEKTIKNGAVFYIRGSVTDPLVKKAQTILLMELIQTVLRIGKQKQHCYLALDEVKFLVSDMLTTGLSTVLSKGINISLAYQSRANMLNLDDKSLNAQAILSEIEINTLTTISYRAADDDTAEWAASLTGTRNKTIVRSEEVDYGKMGAETYTGRKQVHQDQEELISKNQMLSYPPRVSALIRPNTLAQSLYTCWIALEEGEMVDIVDLKPNNQTNQEKEAAEAELEAEEFLNIKESDEAEPIGRSRSKKKAKKKSKPTSTNDDYSFDQFMADAGLNSNE